MVSSSGGDNDDDVMGFFKCTACLNSEYQIIAEIMVAASSFVPLTLAFS